MNSLKEDFKKYIEQFKTSPFLFVGSGLSRRHFGLESWEQLLEKMSHHTDRPYAYYKSSSDSSLPKTASLIAEELHTKWWSNEIFEESRSEFSHIARNKESPLKFEIVKHISQKISPHKDPDDNSKKEIALLKNAVIDGIITTNWDNSLENLFPDFKKYIGQSDILFSCPQHIGEIYKIHGCITDPNSLVLTESDYNEFDKKNPYLAAKLITIFVEHPIIFIGYSLNDENILKLIRSIAACLSPDNLTTLTSRLIFISWEAEWPPEKYEITTSNIVTEGFTLPLHTIKTNNYKEIFESLSEIKRKFPASILRKLKEHVYDIVHDTEKQSKIYVQSLENNTDIANVDVVFGVGAISKIKEIGYKSIGREDIIEDIIFGNQDLDPDFVVRDSLPELLKKADYCPVFKYTSQSSLEKIEQNVQNAKKREWTNLYPAKQYKKKQLEIRSKDYTFKTLLASEGRDYFLYHATLIKTENANQDELGEILRNMHSEYKNGDWHSLLKGQYIKLVCLYDLLRWK